MGWALCGKPHVIKIKIHKIHWLSGKKKKVHATAMTSHESSSVEVQTRSGDVLVSSNWFRQKPATKTVNVSVTCPVTWSVSYSVTTPSQAVHQSADCLVALFSPTLLEGRPLGHWGSKFRATQLIFQPGWGAGRSIPGTPVSTSCPQWAGAPLLCLFVTLPSLCLSVATC